MNSQTPLDPNVPFHGSALNEGIPDLNDPRPLKSITFDDTKDMEKRDR